MQRIPQSLSRLLFYPHLKETFSRLPAHFKEKWVSVANTQAIDVLERESFFREDSHIPSSYYRVPPEVIYPPESDKCLWNGEGIVVGYVKRNEKSQIYPKAWLPSLSQHLFYSEILDHWMMIIVSDSALDAIEKAGGFDAYILSTPEARLGSRLGMHLKRHMLLCLADPKFMLDKPDKRAELLKKYASFILPLEEAEWVGLTLEEAIKKQAKLDHSKKRQQIRPKKYALLEEALNAPPPEEEPSAKSWVSRVLYGQRGPEVKQ